MGKGATKKYMEKNILWGAKKIVAPKYLNTESSIA